MSVLQFMNDSPILTVVLAIIATEFIIRLVFIIKVGKGDPDE